MIPRDATPIGHQPPLPRIDLSPRFEAEAPETLSFVEQAARAREDAVRDAENERIWQLVRQTAAGSGRPVETAEGE